MARLFKLTCQINFDIDGVHSMADVNKNDLHKFIEEALECWGGQRHPDDWLFGSLERVKISVIRQAK